MVNGHPVQGVKRSALPCAGLEKNSHLSTPAKQTANENSFLGSGTLFAF